MPDLADLLIGLRPAADNEYTVEAKLTLPNSDLAQQEDGKAAFDRPALARCGADPEVYGKLLYGQLFADQAVRGVLEQARSQAGHLGLRLRVRLWVTAEAETLQQLRWETLWAPDDGVSLTMDENVLFSRYLSSHDWRGMEHRAREDLRALVAVANPIDLADFSAAAGGPALPPVDAQGEWERAQVGLRPVRAVQLTADGRASLDNLLTHLRDGYDILYLVCHGTHADDDTWLWLEGPDGRVKQASGTDVVQRLSRLAAPPRLIVLAACNSAGPLGGEPGGDGSALAALAPRLTEEGIPAVVAMQGSITQETVRGFMPAFFTEMVRSGQIDLAMTQARVAVRDRSDRAVPALFMRLESGRLWWYEAGFRGGDELFKRWPDILSSIERGACTPVLGPGLHEFLLGSQREVARHWAEAEDFPMGGHNREDLAQVAQFVSVNRSPGYLRDKLEGYLREKMRERYGDILPPALDGAALDSLVEYVGAWRRENNPLEPHRVLASLPLPIYLTANPDNLLGDALLQVQLGADPNAHKQPQVVLCPWNDDIKRDEYRLRHEPPTLEQPLVYHLLGRLTNRKSLVLTEDDYFEYLLGVTDNRNRIPERVRRAQVDSALLFLGFDLDSWDFRVLFRSIMRRQGGARRSEYAHVAVQISPQAPQIANPENARAYLEKEFGTDEISIFWGNVDDFAKELWNRWTSRPGAARSP